MTTDEIMEMVSQAYYLCGTSKYYRIDTAYAISNLFEKIEAEINKLQEYVPTQENSL